MDRLFAEEFGAEVVDRRMSGHASVFGAVARIGPHWETRTLRARTHPLNIQLLQNWAAMGRPPYSRAVFLRYLLRRPGAWRGLILVNQSDVARLIGCHRATIGRMVNELESAGELHRLRSKGRRGLLVTVRPPQQHTSEVARAASID